MVDSDSGSSNEDADSNVGKDEQSWVSVDAGSDDDAEWSDVEAENDDLVRQA
jgi:hypothetical protein